MKHKLMLAIGTGCFTAVRTTEELWFRTNMDVCEIAFLAAGGYIAGVVIAYAADDFYRKRKRAKTKPTINTRPVQRRSYRTDDTVFIDAEAIRRMKRKVIRMKEKMSLRIAGKICQQLMEDLGIWEIEEG